MNYFVPNYYTLSLLLLDEFENWLYRLFISNNNKTYPDRYRNSDFGQ